MVKNKKINRRFFISRTGTAVSGALLATPLSTLNLGCASRAREPEIKHVIVAAQHGRFIG